MNTGERYKAHFTNILLRFGLGEDDVIEIMKELEELPLIIRNEANGGLCT